MMQNDNEKTGTSNPYVGPRAFEYKDRDYYFGRRREAIEVLSLLMARRFLLLYAQSGDGKTSLINAMLRPKLENADQETDEVTAQDQFELLPVGRVGDAIEPDGEVDNRFAFNLMVSLAGDTDREPFTHLSMNDFLLDSVLVGDRLVYTGEQVVLDAANRAQEPTGEFNELTVKPRVLIIDQFEELFTFHPELEEDRAKFLEQLTEAMEKDPYLYVLLSIRADYLANTFSYARLLPDGLRTRYHMERMEEQGALKAICEPPQRANPSRTYDNEVSEKLIKYLSRSGSANGESTSSKDRSESNIELVQLQVVCYQLWESLDNSTGGPITMAELNKAIDDMLKASGREPGEGDPMAAFIDTALADYYEQAIVRVAQESKVRVTEYQLREFFSSKLITAGGVRNLVARDSDSAGIPVSAIDMLQNDYHLIRNDVRGGRLFVELVHDSFIEPILGAERRWYVKRLRDIPWLEDARNYKKDPQGTSLLDDETLRKAKKLDKNDLPPEALVYLKASQDAKKDRQKRTRTIALVAAVLIALVLVLITFNILRLNQELEVALMGREVALDELEVALDENKALRLAETATDYLLDDNPEPAILLSYHTATEITPTQRILLVLFDAINEMLHLSAGQESDAGKQLRGEYLAPARAIGQAIEGIDNIITGPEPGSLASIIDNRIYWWNPTEVTEPVEIKLSLNGEVVSVDRAAFNPVYELLAASQGPELLLWQIDNLTNPVSLPLGKGANDISALAFSEDGKHLAVVRGCPIVRADETKGEGGQASEVGDCGTQSIEIYQIDSANRRALPKGARVEFEVPIVDVVFVDDDEGNRFIWSSSNPPFVGISESETGDIEILESLGASAVIKAMALVLDVADDDLLVIAGCEEGIPDDETGKLTCGPDSNNFLLWRFLSKENLNASSVRTETVSASSDIVYLDNSDQLVTLDEDGNLERWSTNMGDYLAAACSIAGRNLNAAEWKETFPNIHLQDYETICDEHLGIHLSVIEELVRGCEQESLNSAREKWKKADRMSKDMESDTFEDWAAGVLVTKILKDQVRDRSCLEMFEDLLAEQPGSPEIVHLMEWKRQVQKEIDGGKYRGAYTKVAEIAARAENYPPGVRNAMSDQVSSIYGDLCLSGALDPEEQAEACSGIPMLGGDEVVTKTNVRRSIWKISGQEGEYVSFGVQSKEGSNAVLKLYDSQLNELIRHEFYGGESERLEHFLAGDGDYFVEISYLGDVPEYTLSMITTVPEDIILGDNIGAAFDQTYWKISAAVGDALEFVAHTNKKGDANLILFDSEGTELAFDDDINDHFLEIEWPVPEDGDFYLLISWNRDPQSYSLSTAVTKPEPVQIGKLVDAAANQAIWQFRGQQGDLVTIAVQAEGDGDALLSLENDQFNELAYNDDIDDDDFDPLIEEVLPEDGVYFVEVGWNGEPQPYTLFVSIEQP